MYRADDLKKRTKEFALRTIRLFRALPRTEEARVLGRQVLRSATSVAANYRAVCRARSRAEFISRMGVVVEETDETVLWFELFVESGIVAAKRMNGLITEGRELVAIFATSQKTARAGGRLARKSLNQ